MEGRPVRGLDPSGTSTVERTIVDKTPELEAVRMRPQLEFDVALPKFDLGVLNSRFLNEF